MRVIHILEHSLPLRTAYALRTIAMLEQQRARNWETFQLTGPNHDAGPVTEEDVDGWHFYRTPRPGGILQDVPGLGAIESMGEIAYRIECIAHRVRPHILHVHASMFNAIPALRVGRRLGIPVVYEVRPQSEMPHYLKASTDGRLMQAFVRLLETWVLNRADAIAAAHESLRADMVLRGIAATKVTVVPSCLDLKHFAMKDGAFSLADDETLDCGRPEAAAAYLSVYANLMGPVCAE